MQQANNLLGRAALLALSTVRSETRVNIFSSWLIRPETRKISGRLHALAYLVDAQFPISVSSACAHSADMEGCSLHDATYFREPELEKVLEMSR